MSAEIIHVSYQSDSTGDRLIIPTPQTSFTLSAGTSVSWLLSGPNIPPGSLLYVHFETSFGPFHGIRSVTPHALLARGNNGEPGLYSYFLYLIVPSADQVPRIVRSDDVFIDNQSGERDISPEATITWDPATLRISINPPHLNLFDGDTVLWHIIGVPQNQLLTFRFVGDDRASGPFPAIFSLQDVRIPGETGSPRLLGGTFAAPQPGEIIYHVQVWDDQGSFLGGDDPSIDSLGKPPGG